MSYEIIVNPPAQYTIEYSNQRGPQGATGPAGATTTDASLLVSGTLADARLSSNVLLVSGNLAGLANTATARTNLGLGTGDSPSFVGLTLTGTGTLQLPSGTTAQRVASQGIRWNTTDSRHEFYTGSTWYNHARLTGDTFTGAVVATTLSESATAATGTGGLVRATSPTLVTPNIGAATGTSLTVTDVSLVRGGTGFWRVLADNGFAVRNAANNADSPLSCSTATATQLTVNATSGIIGTIYGNATDNYLLIGKTGVPAQSALIGNSDSGGMGAHVFFTISGRPTSDFRVLANGNVLVGATSDTGQKFQVTGNTLVSSTLTVGSTLISPLVVLGSGGPVIKNVSGTHTFRNSPDSADAPILCSNVTATANGAASTPATTLTGTWFTGGTATTTKPQLLVEPTGTTSTNWSTSGTGIGINAASGFGGDLINAQIAGSNIFRVSSGSVVTASFFRDSGNQANYFGAGINTRNTWLVAYSNDGTDFGTKDLSYSRNAAGVLQIGNGTANASGSLLLTNLTASGTLRVGGGTIITNVLSATATLDFGSIAANSVADLTISVTGAAVGDTVAIGVPNASLVADVSFFGWVSATDTVTIRATNNSSTTARDPASGTFRATVIRF